MAVQFGTDGIRGTAGVDVTTSLAYQLGWAVARRFTNVPVFVGADTRESSPALANAVLAGLIDGGARAVNLGVFTTPGVAIIAEQRGGAGVIVSASHNPFADNGLKVLGVRGQKLDHDAERALEDFLDAAPEAPSREFASVAIDERAQGEYLQRLRTTVSDNALSGMSVVLDCANGAASSFAGELFTSLGASVVTLHASPDGTNINRECGSTHPGDLVREVLARGADLGLAFDGDADRLIAVDAKGQVRDGDDLMVLFALDLHQRGELGDALVVTSMSNLGMRRALASAGVALRETDVGDRNVLMALEEEGLSFGGEQSGHLIFRSLAPTGDGMLTGILLAELVQRTGPLDQRAGAAWQRVPQALVNIARDEFSSERVGETFAALKASFAVADADVRLLVRPSGTESVVRVMVESVNKDFVDAFVSALA